MENMERTTFRLNVGGRDEIGRGSIGHGNHAWHWVDGLISAGSLRACSEELPSQQLERP